MIRIDPTSGVPIYLQIVEQFTRELACGRLAVGDKLPSVRDLARALPANQNTVLKAYERLENDGVIERRHGDGTYVSGKASPLKKNARRKLIAEHLESVVAKAIVLQIPLAELRVMLDEQWAAAQEYRESSANRTENPDA